MADTAQVQQVQNPPSSPPELDQAGIEDILFKQGLLNRDQLTAIKLESINSGQSAEKLIIQHGLVPSDKLLIARSQMLSVPYMNLETRGILADVLNYIPEAVARRYKLIPFDKQGNRLLVAMEDPLDLQVIQFLEKKSGLFITPYLATSEGILKAINEQYSQNLTTEVTSALKEVSAFEQAAAPTQAEETEVIREAPVVNIITHLMEYAIKSRASDIHIEPLEDKTRVRYRIDGILHEKVILPQKVHDALVSRIKILSSLKIDEKRLPQDGRYTFEFNKLFYDLRISIVPTIFGEKVVIRLLPKAARAPTLPELGLRGQALKDLESQILRPHGIVLVCGPTGSGKTTTLYSILTKISTTAVNILTIEDPVEYQIPGANQVQVNPQIGLTFASALRSFLRQDPNIILVGEIRDTETAELAIQAALTGHGVFSTLHTNSASGALPRLLDMGAEPFLLVSSINAIVGQRILRQVCPHCRTSYNPPSEVVANLKAVLGKLLPDNKQITLYKGVGCNVCGHTGYMGRIGIFEVLIASTKIMNLIYQRSSSQDIEKAAHEEGMIILLQDGYLKAIEGVTTLEEVLRVAES